MHHVTLGITLKLFVDVTTFASKLDASALDFNYPLRCMNLESEVLSYIFQRYIKVTFSLTLHAITVGVFRIILITHGWHVW